MKKVLLLLFVSSLNLLSMQEVKWETNLESALIRAKAENKIVFVDVWAAWCGPCIRLKKEVFPTPIAQAALAQVIPLDLQTRTEDNSATQNVWAETAYSIEAYPSMLFLDQNGKRIGNMQLGFITPEKLSSWISEMRASYSKKPSK